MRTRTQAGSNQEAGVEISDPRAVLRLEVARLTEAECREVSEYIDIMRSLKGEGDSRELFGDGFARRVSAMCDGRRGLSVAPLADTLNARA